MMPRRIPGSVLGILPTGDMRVNGWVTFDGTAGTVSAAGSHNLSSLTDNGAGDYTVTWDLDLPSAVYAVLIAASLEAGIAGANMRMWALDDTSPLAAGSTRVEFRNNSTRATADPSVVCVAVIGGGT